MTFQVCGTVTLCQSSSLKPCRSHPRVCPTASGSVANRQGPDRESFTGGKAVREPGCARNGGGAKAALGAGLHSDRCQSKESPRTRAIPLKGCRKAGSEYGTMRVAI